MWTNENRGRYDHRKLRCPSDLTDEAWALIEPLIPPAKRGGNKRTVDMRTVIDGLIPKDLAARSTVYDYFSRWDYDGTLDRMHHVLYVKCRALAEHEASPTAAIVDSQSVKGAEKGGPALIRRAMMPAKVRLEGVHHLWRKVPSGELSVDPEADERRGWATGLLEAS